MAPKAVFILLGALLAVFLILSSDVAVAAAEQEQQTKDDAAAAGDALGDNKQVHGCARGCCSWFRGRCVRCCHASEKADTAGVAAFVGDNKQRHCRCCSWFRRRCAGLCCPNGEKFTIDWEAMAEPQN